MSSEDDVTMKQVLLARRLLTGYLRSLLESVGVMQDVSLLPCLLLARTGEQNKTKGRECPGPK